MVKLGNKYTCGGREFWCVGLKGGEEVTLQSGGVKLTVSPARLERDFQFVNALAVGESYTAKHTYESVQEGETYTVASIGGEGISFECGITLGLEAFTATF